MNLTLVDISTFFYQAHPRKMFLSLPKTCLKSIVLELV